MLGSDSSVRILSARVLSGRVPTAWDMTCQMLGSEGEGQGHPLDILCCLALPALHVCDERASLLFPDTVPFPVFMGETAQEHTLSLPLCLLGVYQGSFLNKPLVSWVAFQGLPNPML